jgi:3-deoxy-D-manno-octulosonate 8-phosphate phosphatase KdsC-like HAD superfamily phosphatase
MIKETFDIPSTSLSEGSMIFNITKETIKDFFALDGGVIFIFRSNTIKKGLISGKLAYIEVKKPESLDIDSLDDLKFAEKININL